MLRRWWRSKRTAVAGIPESGDDDDDASEWVRAGELVELRRHRPENRSAFQRWYADPEIAGLLRHDQEPLSPVQSRGYFDSFILPLSARGACWAIHERETGRLIGTTAMTDIVNRRNDGASGLFRIVIGEKDVWGLGYGTEATKLALDEAFDEMNLDEVRLEVFRHNPRAIAAYRRVGFAVTGEHVEWLHRRRTELHVLEMAIDANVFWDLYDEDDDSGDWDDEDEDQDGLDDEDSGDEELDGLDDEESDDSDEWDDGRNEDADDPDQPDSASNEDDAENDPDPEAPR
jgi:RimJ/RimL family protein N-acetyltransferase